jgi:glyoxylase-like metal-dependent hydrolase (beta-lactamase superfamily II)
LAEITRSFHTVDGVTVEYSPGVESRLGVSVLIGDGGLTLFDTGMPGSLGPIEKYLKSIGRDLSEIKHIVLTHLDNDHIGSAPELKKQTNANVVLHEIDVKLATDRSIGKDELRKMFPSYASDDLDRLMEKISGAREIDLQVDVKVSGKSLSLPGVSVIHTPGHTPGHCCAYLASESLLISGDALSFKNGKINDSIPIYTVKMSEARRSLRNLNDQVRFERLVSYHDEPILHGAQGLLREYLASVGA